MALVLIDVDGTLVPDANGERLFFRYLLARHQLGLPQLMAFLWFPLRYGWRFCQHVGKKNKAYLCGLPIVTVEKLAADFVTQVLIQELSPKLRHRLERHRKHGDTLALLTGTPDFIARPLASRLSIPHVMATICDHRKGRFTARPPRRHPFAIAKVETAQVLCQRLGVTLSTCIAYADSVHDIPLLSRVGHGVAVAPGLILRRQAIHRGWEILDL